MCLDARQSHQAIHALLVAALSEIKQITVAFLITARTAPLQPRLLDQAALPAAPSRDRSDHWSGDAEAINALVLCCEKQNTGRGIAPAFGKRIHETAWRTLAIRDQSPNASDEDAN